MMKAEQVRLLWGLFSTFLRIAPSAFGGGYAMLPTIEREVVHRRNWVTEEEMADMIAISGSAPGGVGVNAAAFIGYRMAGIPGAALSVLGMMLPPFIIAFGLSFALSHSGGHPKIAAALKGIQAGVVGLIILAAYQMAKKAVFDKATLGVSIATVAVLLLAPIHPAFVVGAGLVVGSVLVSVKRKLGLQIRLDKESKHEEDPAPAPRYRYPDYYIADGI